MTRHVLCLDGTNNYPAGGYTNVQRLFRTLQRNEAQLTYYQPGVGTLQPDSVTSSIAKRALMVVDAMSAIYLERHVCAAYRYLMRNWREGDEIFLFGFSRGAFAVRVLAGMLARVGLLHDGFDEMVAFAWKAYLAPWDSSDGDEPGNRFRRHYCRFVPGIRFIGLFDSVSAVGLPWLPRRFAYTFDNPRVATVRQALALDERRVMFVQNRWSDRPRERDGATTDVEQVWFAGNHSDVGGGYGQSEAGLSLIPLAWMMREAQAAGVQFKPKVSKAIFPLEPRPGESHLQALTRVYAGAQQHDELELRRWWWALEYLPVPRMRRRDDEHWQRTWLLNRGAARSPHHDVPMRVHRSVELRAAGIYRPQVQIQADAVYVD